MTSKIYLDACIFIACAHKKHKNHELIKACIGELAKYQVQLYSSEWALIELMRVLVKDYDYSIDKAHKIADEFKKSSKIRLMSIEWVDLNTGPDKRNYTDLFEYLKTQLVTIKEIHLADAIHGAIMSNNDVDIILTTDKDFEVIKEITIAHPSQFCRIIPKTTPTRSD